MTSLHSPAVKPNLKYLLVNLTLLPLFLSSFVSLSLSLPLFRSPSPLFQALSLSLSLNVLQHPQWYVQTLLTRVDQVGH